jgi:hypothetical protein
MFKKKYYRHKNRLADVLALIQVLAFDKKAHRSVNGLNSELQQKPKSAESWKDIAIEHPEFFRINKEKHEEEGDEGHTISLIARHVKLNNETRLYETLSPDLTKKFFETAIQLHDIQKERADIWKVWLPILIAIITVLSSFYVQYTNNQNQTFLKHYEVDLKPKQEGYATFMKSVSQSFLYAQQNNTEQMYQSLDKGEGAYYILEPFLSNYDRERIWQQYQQFSGLCSSVLESDSSRKSLKKTVDSFIWYKTFFRTNLYNALFISEKSLTNGKK